MTQLQMMNLFSREYPVWQLVSEIYVGAAVRPNTSKPWGWHSRSVNGDDAAPYVQIPQGRNIVYMGYIYAQEDSLITYSCRGTSITRVQSGNDGIFIVFDHITVTTEEGDQQPYQFLGWKITADGSVDSTPDTPAQNLVAPPPIYVIGNFSPTGLINSDDFTDKITARQLFIPSAIVAAVGNDTVRFDLRNNLDVSVVTTTPYVASTSVPVWHLDFLPVSTPSFNTITKIVLQYLGSDSAWHDVDTMLFGGLTNFQSPVNIGAVALAPIDRSDPPNTVFKLGFENAQGAGFSQWKAVGVVNAEFDLSNELVSVRGYTRNTNNFASALTDVSVSMNPQTYTDASRVWGVPAGTDPVGQINSGDLAGLHFWTGNDLKFTINGAQFGVITESFVGFMQGEFGIPYIAAIYNGQFAV